MVDAREIYNFQALILPDGEDNISYRYDDGALVVDIPYELNTKMIRLRFEHCSYLFFSPLPGYCPPELEPGFYFHSSRVYELVDSPQVEAAVAAFTNASYQPAFRHYLMYLEWENVVFQIIAQSCEVVEGDR